MKYLLSAIVLHDEVFQDFKRWRESVAFSHGVTVDARIDWRSVANFCAPHVLVMMTYDKTGREFVEYPLYAVLPESHQSIRLDDLELVSLTVGDDRKLEVDVQGALNLLVTHAQSIQGGKGENAMRQLQILKRILK